MSERKSFSPGEAETIAVVSASIEGGLTLALGLFLLAFADNQIETPLLQDSIKFLTVVGGSYNIMRSVAHWLVWLGNHK